MTRIPFVRVDRELRGLGTGATVPLGEMETRHLATVLRLPPQAALEVSDGEGCRAPARLESGEVRLVGPVTVDPAPRPALVVVQALPKSRKMDEVVRQTAELGVDELIPVVTRRSLVRLQGERARSAVDRWRAVARSAAEQSRRSRGPRIGEVTSVPALVRELTSPSDGGAVFVAHPGAEGLPRAASRVLRPPAAHGPPQVVLAIGPEGGWADEEIDTFTSSGAACVGMGTNVLRTEHAAAAGLAVLAALAGRWG